MSFSQPFAIVTRLSPQLIPTTNSSGFIHSWHQLFYLTKLPRFNIKGRIRLNENYFLSEKSPSPETQSIPISSLTHVMSVLSHTSCLFSHTHHVCSLTYVMSVLSHTSCLFSHTRHVCSLTHVMSVLSHTSYLLRQ